MLQRSEWLELTRHLDWDLSYVREQEAFPPTVSGHPYLPQAAWQDWEEPYKTCFAEYVTTQTEKDASVYAVRDLLGKADNLARLPPAWVNALKLHSATLPLAEFAAVVGNLRAARFAKNSAWRTAAAFGALDEFRHTQIPLLLMHDLVKWDPQFDWTHRFYHTDNWVAVAARHVIDELLLTSDPVEFAIATNFVFETGFTNLQFIGLSALAHGTGDYLFEKMTQSIQTDEARHSQIGPVVLREVVKHDRAYAQYLLDKWFWRFWHIFAVVTGFSMDYLTPLAARTQSFKSFMHEWILDQFLSSLEEYGLEKPWYWETFLSSLDNYHHKIYASAYTYRTTVWFNFVVPSPEERAWLRAAYPDSWPAIDPIWDKICDDWRGFDRGLDFAVHGTAIIGFCNLCQMVLCEGDMQTNTATTAEHGGRKYIFCSEPCKWIFEKESDCYAEHKDVVKKVLAGEAPGNVLALITQHFNLTSATWGKDTFAGQYPWLQQPAGPR